jgi:glycosyltransferase involved in cell wall biosynthesis
MTARISNKDSRDDLKKVFMLFDEEKSGFISLASLKKVVKELGENIDEAELQEMIHLDHVRYAGHVSPQDKTSLIASAFAVINPSSHESLSLITLEALALGTPVLVNQNSEVLAYYAREVPTCFAYTDRTSLTRALGKLLDEAHTPDWPKQIETSKQWTQRNFDWHEVIKNFDIAINGQLFDRKPFQP